MNLYITVDGFNNNSFEARVWPSSFAVRWDVCIPYHSAWFASWLHS